MLRRLLIGLLKGLAVGGAIGALLHFGAHWTSIAGALNYLLYGVVAALAGAIAGQPPWRQGAWVGTILKAIFGFGVGAGLYALASRFLTGVPGATPDAEMLAHSPLLFAPAVAVLYATLVELDDGGEQQDKTTDKGTKTGVRVTADVDDIEVDEVERGEKSTGAKARR